VEQGAERGAAGRDGVALGGGEGGERDGEDAVFDELAGGRGAEEDFAQVEIGAGRAVGLEHFDAERAAVVVGERGRHVTRVVEEGAGGGRERGAGERGEGLEREAAGVVEIGGERGGHADGEGGSGGGRHAAGARGADGVRGRERERWS